MRDAISTRMGDGERVTMSASELKEEILAGTVDAAEKGDVPQLTDDELDKLFEIVDTVDAAVAAVRQSKA